MSTDTKKRTDAEIKAELARLLALKGKLPHFDSRKTNNWELLRAQTAAVRFGLTLEELKQQFSDVDAQGAGEDAIYWMDGGAVLSPSESWAGVLEAQESDRTSA